MRARACLRADDDVNRVVKHARFDVYLYLIATGNGATTLRFNDIAALRSILNPLVYRFLRRLGFAKLVPRFGTAQSCKRAWTALQHTGKQRERCDQIDVWFEQNIGFSRLQARNFLEATGLYVFTDGNMSPAEAHTF